MRLGFILPLLITAALVAFLALGIGRALDHRWQELDRQWSCLSADNTNPDCRQSTP
jgi:hypothetical protein